jgi:transposase InsO family protein
MAAPTTQWGKLNLVEKSNVDLAPVERLTKKSDFDHWLFIVRGELFRHNVLELINKELERPEPANEQYLKWHQASANVSIWLRNQVSREILQEIRDRASELDYADDMFTEIQKFCKGDASNKMGWSQLIDFWEVRRINFNNPEDYITAFRVAYRNMVNAKVSFSPGVATVILMNELKPDLSSWVTITTKDIKPIDQITNEDFQTYSVDALDEARQWAKNNGNAAFDLNRGGNNTNDKKRDNKNGGLENKNNNNGNKRKYAPSANQDIHVHAAALRKLPSKDGNCGYCEKSGHSAETCFFLIEEPKKGWRPTGNLWSYSHAVRAQKNAKSKQEEKKETGDKLAQATMGYYMTGIGGAAVLVPDCYETAKKPRPWIAPRTSTLFSEAQSTVDNYVIKTLSTNIDAPTTTSTANEPPPSSLTYSLSTLDGSITHSFSIQTGRVDGEWIADSGASKSIVGDGTALISYESYGPGEAPCRFSCSNGEQGVPQGHGIAVIRLDNGENQYTDLMVNCYYISGLKFNLWATEEAKIQNKVWYCAKDNTIRRMSDDSKIGRTRTVGGVPVVYTVDMKEEITLAHAALATVSTTLQHRRLAHVGDARRILTEKTSDLEEAGELHDICEPCQLGKAKRLVSRDPLPKAEKVGQILHIDVQAIKPTGFDGTNYFTCFLDDYSRMPFARFHNTKGEASDACIAFCKEFHTKAGYWPTIIVKDLGREFNRFNKFATEQGIELRHTAPRTPEPRGAIERLQYFIVQCARVMMIDAGLPYILWPLAIETAVYIISRLTLPTKEKAPLQIWREELKINDPIPSLQHLRVWGCKAYEHIPPEDRVKAEKMAPKAKITRLVGYVGDHGKMFKIWHPDTGKISISRDVTFWEGENGVLLRDIRDEEPIAQPDAGKRLIFKINDQEVANSRRMAKRIANTDTAYDIDELLRYYDPHLYDYDEHEYEFERVRTISDTPSRADEEEDSEHEGDSFATAPDDEQEQVSSNRGQNPTQKSISEIAPATAQTENIEKKSSNNVDKPPPRRSERTTKGQRTTKRYDEEDFVIGIAVSTINKKKWDIQIPDNDREALQSPERDFWEAAMKEQVDKLENNGTWRLIPLPKDKPRPLPGKWVYDIKSAKDGTIEEFRARWVVCGNMEKKDGAITWSPVANDLAMKIFLSFCAHHGLNIYQADIIAAYLHAWMKRNRVLMMQPRGFEKGIGMVCLLLKALYGLRESANLWFHTITEKLVSLGFKPLPEEPCILWNKTTNILMILYVDDTLIAGKHMEDIERLLDALHEAYGVKRIGQPQKFLGCHLEYDISNRTIFISQQPYVNEVLNSCNLENCSGYDFPMELSYKLEYTGKRPDEQLLKEYRKILGKENWLTCKTRPDIAFSVGRLQHKSEEPTTQDKNASKRILRYLKKHPNYGLLLNQAPGEGLNLFTDSAFADHPDGKSTEGWVLFWAGTPIAWCSKKQSIVATSSTCSEYICFSDAITFALYAKRILVSLGLMKDDDKIKIFTDSDNGVDAVNKPTAPSVRWLKNKYHFIRNVMKDGEIEFHRVDTKENVADGLTKAKDLESFTRFRELLRMTKREIVESEE